jgi:hypothetical protein
MKGNIKHKKEVEHHSLVERKQSTLAGKLALLWTWEKEGDFDPAYLSSLRLGINKLKAQLRAMGGME